MIKEENFNDIYANEDDLETLRKAVEYLEENYTEPLGQGPILLTGSSISEGSDEYPNDFDIVVKRKAEDQRQRRRSRTPGLPKGDPKRKVFEDYIDKRGRKRGAVDPQNDYEVLAEMMNDLSEDEEFDDYRSDFPSHAAVNYLRRSENATDRGNIGTSHTPVTRVELEIQGTDLDIIFSNNRIDHQLELTEIDGY